MDLQKFKQQNPAVSRHKKIIRKFGRNNIISRRLYSHIFADTIHAYKKYASENDGMQYVMVLIDGLSRRVHAEGMKNTTVQESIRVLTHLFKRLNERRGHSFFESDAGPEFSDELAPLLEQFEMSHVVLQGPHKASLAERVM
jgi:stalled ribosome rescue protein Dom34